MKEKELIGEFMVESNLIKRLWVDGNYQHWYEHHMALYFLSTGQMNLVSTVFFHFDLSEFKSICDKSAIRSLTSG